LSSFKIGTPNYAYKKNEADQLGDTICGYVCIAWNANNEGITGG